MSANHPTDPRLAAIAEEAERRRSQGARQYTGKLYHPDDVRILKNAEGTLIGYYIIEPNAMGDVTGP